MKLLALYAAAFSVFILFSGIFHFAALSDSVGFPAWLVAARYAAATTAALLFIPTLVYLLSWKLGRLKKWAFQSTGFVMLVVAVILSGDMIYYRQAGKHLTVEFAIVMQNPSDILAMAWAQYRILLVGIVVCSAALLFAWFRFTGRLNFTSERALWQRALALPFFVLISLIAFRGGLQDRPMRPADAYQYLPQRAADFALNGIYTSFYTLYHREEFPARGDAESIRLARNLISRPQEQFTTAGLPFYRSLKSEIQPLKKNLVIIILESWSARRIGAFGDRMAATPFFDSLARKGWLFTNAFATGRRSIAALPSVISSIPTLFGSLYITSPHEQNFQRGLGTLVRGHGYSTLFAYAAKAGSMGFNAYARLAGFEKIITRESFAADAPYDGAWGIYDHVTFSRVLSEIETASKPFVSVVYTLHPHPPFNLPAGKNFYPPDIPRAGYYNALRYSDDTLREFFAEAAKRPWFRDTVFILTADHAFEETQGYDAFHIPLLFYSPGFIAARSDVRVASQLDILPTILDLLHFDDMHASMGKSLLAPGPRVALIDNDHATGLVRAKDKTLFAVMFGAEKYIGYYDMRDDREWQQTNAGQPFAPVEIQAMRAYLDVMGYVIRENRIAPRAN